MNEEDLYRGWSAELDKMVCGSLVSSGGPGEGLQMELKLLANHIPPYIIDENGIWSVDLKSIGRYTGKRDINKKRVFSLDIVKCKKESYSNERFYGIAVASIRLDVIRGLICDEIENHKLTQMVGVDKNFMKGFFYNYDGLEIDLEKESEVISNTYEEGLK